MDFENYLDYFITGLAGSLLTGFIIRFNPDLEPLRFVILLMVALPAAFIIAGKRELSLPALLLVLPLLLGHIIAYYPE